MELEGCQVQQAQRLAREDGDFMASLGTPSPNNIQDDWACVYVCCKGFLGC